MLNLRRFLPLYSLRASSHPSRSATQLDLILALQFCDWIPSFPCSSATGSHPPLSPQFDGGLINIVYAWCQGASFGDLCDMCDLFEGSIVRAIRRPCGSIVCTPSAGSRSAGHADP